MITKTANPAGPVSSGDTIGFDVVVSNNGPGTATGVTITDPLPAGGDLNWSISPAVTGCAITGPLGTQVLGCTFAGTLGVASEPTVHITSSTTQADCATVSNTATGAASNDGSATSTASVAVQCPNLSITKTANPVGPVSAGDSIGFDITVSNAGPGTAHAVTVSDTLPAGLDLDWSINPSVTGCSIGGSVGAQTLTCSLGDMGAQTSQVIHVTSSTSAADFAAVGSSAAVVATSEDLFGLPVASVVVQCPIIHITKTANPAGPVSAGTNIGFDIVVSNSGPGTATGVTITDPLPAGGDLNWSISPPVTGCGITGTVGTQVLGCTFAGTLGVASEPTVHITSSTTQADCATVSNTATGAATNDGQDTSTATVTVNCPPMITLTKTADDSHVDSGDKIGFTITVHNASAGPATNVTVTDNLPGKDGLDWSMKPLVSGCTITGPKESQVLSCTFTVLPGGTSVSIHIVTKTTHESCGTVKNTATATADGGATATAGPVKITVSCPEEQQGNPGGGENGGEGEHTPTPAPPTAPVPNPAPIPVNPPKPVIAPIRALSAAPNTGVGMSPAWGLMAVWTGLIALVGSWFGGRDEEHS